jgi:rhodanese-related sulfurtransferase
MEKPPAQAVLDQARERARGQALPYFGALTPREAHRLMESVPGTRLVDVRTRAELDWVGRIPGATEIEWNTYPGGARNPAFVEQLIAAVPDADAPVLFLCRSGGRSDQAARAAAQAGYRYAINVLEGFEGDKDASAHRGNVGGWRKAGLPWVQG